MSACTALVILLALQAFKYQDKMFYVVLPWVDLNVVAAAMCMFSPKGRTQTGHGND
jgi:hypothetical protein